MVYLKGVTAYGFKSFADKTNVTFVRGLTAIVGPNGSGKSNITDAIRWVLGEQSAKNLRGARMEDVIFSGALNRQPLNYAEVTLKLDNELKLIDSDPEIEVTRRLYRSGESEYFLNKNKVRLKDITDLFLDTGLGKEAFSIISQGKVDEILNAKAEDRRHLIEEAAGVLKYKKRKKETEAKLAETMGNLARVNDIIFDLEGRVEPLKMEAAIALEYQELTQEMKDADIQVTVFDIKQLKTDYSKLEQDIKEYEEMILLKQDKAARLEQRIAQTTEEKSVSAATLDELNDKLLELTEQIERNQGQYHLLTEKKDNHAASTDRLQRELTKLSQEITERKESQQESAELINEAKREVKQLRKEERTLEQKLTELNSDIEQLIEEARDSYYETLSEQTSSKNELKLIDRQIEQLTAYIESHQAVDNDSENYHEARQLYSQSEQQLIELEQQLTAARDDYKKESTNVSLIHQSYKEEEENLFKAYRYIEQLKSKHQSIVAMQAEYQGYFQGVRTVLKDTALSGIHGAVAELIDIDSKYQTALDIALGSQLQSIITEDEDSARMAIASLKKKKAGRATFLPLSTIRKRELPESVRQQLAAHDGFVGILSELITTDKRYQAVIQNLSGLTIIAESLTVANQLARVANYKYRIVTLDGNIVNPGGSMTGGSVSQPSILLKQKEEEQQLAEKINQYESSTKSLEKNVSALKEKLTESEQRVQTLRRQGEALAEERQEKMLDLTHLEQRLAQLKRANEAFNELSDRRMEQAQLKLQATALKQSMTSSEKELSMIQQKLEEYTAFRTDSRTHEKEVSASLNDVRSRRIIQEERLKYQEEQSEQMSHHIKKFDQQMTELSEQNEMTSVEEITAKISELSAELSDMQSMRTTVEQQLALLKTTMQEQEELLNYARHDYNEAMRQISGLENGIGQMKSQYSRIDVQLENLIYHLLEDYHMTFEAAAIDYADFTDIESLRKRVKLTKASIEELGPVNIGAIKQYEEVEKRYDFLTEQESDLLAAKATLETIIRDMDKEVTARFTDTFKQVQENFHQVFSELFGGGTGELTLNSDDLLTAGVEMMVEPPGKKRQHLTLLSGGERALTAVALLFSILKVRSAPFVILDEVEAALDEANVVRFGNYLQTLSGDTQFIVITHRKGTMEAADRLYGVTMQNSGITQLVSVNLNELNQEKVKELTR
ncbi:chromosome segregation protein SMC [Macrococcus lamae]|uniref:Chromosome partition protein Smc n=1 Tax=Macrococcus lamae TaxID=198484 RepID=A0A4V3BEU4_9STAP|nr:chromosome segregation protein SMC [Macrococcus lamae]TDM07129.1 chromosome segregation protein SMC [Macrococcus lamae]